MVEPLVTIDQGQVRGKTGKNYNGNLYFSFQGIPYAKPPLGELRFKRPQPAEKWDGVFDATKEGDASYSRDFVTNEVVGSEDCLFINVYTPELPKDGKESSGKAVMVFIHGGGFVSLSSSSSWFGPEFLLIEDVILVTFNYRLGLLGFINFEDMSLGVPGNAGIKDMVMALKWVQKNISKFSGDPNNVTIFGESAGSRAVNTLILSPICKDLFHKAILQSGSTLSDHRKQLFSPKKLASALGLTYSDDAKLLKDLQTINKTDILKAQDELIDVFAFKSDEKIRISPVIEQPTEEAIITKDPFLILNEGSYNQVPIMIGYTSHEGMILEVDAHLRKRKFEINTNLEDFIPADLNLETGSQASIDAAQKIKEYFFGDRDIAGEMTDEILNVYYWLVTDRFFLCDIYGTAKRLLRTSKCNVYFYRFSLDTSLNGFKQLGNIQLPGTCHADDLSYLFNSSLTPTITPGSPEDIAIRRVVKLWATFAKYGDPNPPIKDPLINVKFEPIAEQVNFLEIGEELIDGNIPDPIRIIFWEELFMTNSENPDRIEL